MAIATTALAHFSTSSIKTVQRVLCLLKSLYHTYANLPPSIHRLHKNCNTIQQNHQHQHCITATSLLTVIMSSKRKDLLKPKPKPKPKGRAKAQEPQTENDFLDAADEFEQAAGKWRAGDAVKAARFFNRAIEAYNEGLKRYPQSFDLAYNK